MNFFKKSIFKAAAVIMIAAMLVLTAGCSDAEKPQDSEIDISAIEGENSEAGSEVSSSETENASSEAPENSDAAQSGEVEYKDLEIETPYCTLYFPGDWGELLETEIDDGKNYSITFKAKLNSGKVQELFYIHFGEDLVDPIGTITTADGKIVEVMVVLVEGFKPGDDWTDNEAHIVFSMMELVNEVIAKMPIEPIEGAENEDPEEGESGSASSRPGTDELPPEMAGDMALDTPYGELHFPAEWSDKLVLDFSEDGKVYIVEFGCKIGGHEEKPLFTIYLGGSEGAEIGKMKLETGESVSVRISVYELSFDESWAEEEKNIAYAMQEDLNYLISKLG